MKNNIKLFNLIGGIALSLYAIYRFVLFIMEIMNLDSSLFHYSGNIPYLMSLFSLFILLVALGIAGIMYIVDYFKTNEENQQDKLPVMATFLALAWMIPWFIGTLVDLPINITNNNLTFNVPFIMYCLTTIIVVVLYMMNRKMIIEFVKNKMQVATVNKFVITKILHCIGGGLLSAFIFFPMMRTSIYAMWEKTIPFIILILVVVCGVTIKIVNNKTGAMVKLCTLYLLAILEYALLVGSSGEFFMNDGIGWMILKVAGAAFVLFCQFLFIGKCFEHYNKRYGEFIASLLIGAAAISTTVFAIITAIYAIIIAIVAVVGYVVLKIATASSGSSGGKRGKKGLFATYKDGSTEEFEESGINLMGEKTYKNKRGSIEDIIGLGDRHTEDEIKRGAR